MSTSVHFVSATIPADKQRGQAIFNRGARVSVPGGVVQMERQKRKALDSRVRENDTSSYQVGLTERNPTFAVRVEQRGGQVTIRQPDLREL